MTTRRLAVLLALALSGPAVAQNADATIGVVVTRLNGTPSKVGTLESSGTSISNAATATPFTVTVGTTYMIQCNAAANVNLAGATASTTVTSASYGFTVATTDPPFVWVARSASISFVPTAGGAAKCAVWQMT
jgi:hypothetical protein